MQSNNCDILGVRINNVAMKEATKIILSYINGEYTKVIFTPNPEFVINALNNKDFMNILNSSDLNIADGIGIVIGANILGTPIKERVAGYDLVQNIFSIIKNQNKTVYFLGSDEETVIKAKENMEFKHTGLNIIGFHNGYFSDNEESLIIQEINTLQPDMVLVGLGSPRQEYWIFKNKFKLNTKVMIGVGGSFDVMSGKVKRAPKMFIKLNLEWFYRLITQPTRFKRMIKLPLFILQILKYKILGEKNEPKN